MVSTSAVITELPSSARVDAAPLSQSQANAPYGQAGVQGSIPSAGAGNLTDVQEAIARGLDSSNDIVARIDPLKNPQLQTAGQPNQAARETEPAVNLAQVFSHADNLASKNAWTPFDKDKTEKQIQSDLRQLAERYGERLGEKGLEQVVERYFETRGTERERALLQEVRLAARTAANQSFNSNPAAAADLSNKQTALNNIAQKYADVFTSANAEKLQQSMIESYKSTYDNYHQSRWDSELGWAERAYYGARRSISEAWNGAKSVAINVGTQAGNGLLALANGSLAMVSAPFQTSGRIASGVIAVGQAGVELGRDAIVAGIGAAGRVIEGIGAVCEVGLEIGADVLRAGKDLGAKAAGATYDFLTSADTWKAIGSGLWSAGKFGLRCGWAVISCPFKLSTYVAIGNGIAACAKGAWAVCKFAGSCAWAVVSCPFKASTYQAIWGGIKACWSGIAAAYNFASDQENWKALGRGLATAGVALATFSVNVWRDPQAAWQTLKTTGVAVGSAIATAAKYAGGLVYDIGKALGVVDLGVGLWNGAKNSVMSSISAVGTGVQLVKDFALLAGGRISADDLKNNLKDNIKKTAEYAADSFKSYGQAVGGFARAVGELTGINDLGRMCVAIYHGRWSEAAMHLGFAALSFGTLAATVATGGLAVGSMAAAVGLRGGLKAAGQVAVKGVSRASLNTFMRTASKELGEKIVQKTAVGIQKAGVEVAKEAMSSATTRVISQGVNSATREGALAVAREVAKGGAEKAVYNVVRPATTEFFHKAASKEVSAVLKQMVAAGQCTAKEARLISRGFETAMRGGNPALINQLREGIEVAAKKPLLEVFNNGLERGIIEAAPAARARLIKAGASPAHADELLVGIKEGTRIGAREGFEAGLKRGIKDGIKAAIKLRTVPMAGAASVQSFKASELNPVNPWENRNILHDEARIDVEEAKRLHKKIEFGAGDEVNLSRPAGEKKVDTAFSFFDHYKDTKNKGPA